VVQYLGLTVDTNLIVKGDKHIIEIVVSPSSLPVSYHSVFYYRSGNTKQELKGAALNNFLLRKIGQTWDGITTEYATIADIDSSVVKLFIRKARDSNRISQDVNPEDIKSTLQNLNLLNENSQPKNAAILAFGKNPSRQIARGYHN
jgi:ATP-dependent DNA helicase RecG